MRLLILTAVLSLCASAKDPIVGAWKLDPEKSRTSGKLPAGSVVARIEPDPNCFQITYEALAADGKPSQSVQRFLIDAREHPDAAGSAGETITYERPDDRTIVTTFKRDGKIVGTLKRVVSEDGKTMTVSRSGMSAAGGKYEDVLVYRKQ
ncbi:MAG: hypothetical protein HYS04_22245 [Acidobacteria bacterium]|nr:hypothetical protein [Acidobacteriota bacterium]